MKKTKEESILLPVGYEVLDKMGEIEGGRAITLQTRRDYLNKDVCLAKAKYLKQDGYCLNMTRTEVAQEIHAHAVYGYYGAAAVPALATVNPMVATAAAYIASKGLDGISLGDNKDEWYRVEAYKLAWGV